jgi:hypothetical protein
MFDIMDYYFGKYETIENCGLWRAEGIRLGLPVRDFELFIPLTIILCAQLLVAVRYALSYLV